MAWQSGQHQPDSLAAATVAYDVLAHAITEPMRIISPLDVDRTRTPPGWMTRKVGGR